MKNLSTKKALPYIWYSLIICSWLSFQIDLKLKPQILTILLSALMLFQFMIKSNPMFKVMKALLILSLNFWFFLFLYTSVTALIPQEHNSSVSMNISGIIGAAISFILAVMVTFLQMRRAGNEFYNSDYFLAAGTLVFSLVVMVYQLVS